MYIGDGQLLVNGTVIGDVTEAKLLAGNCRVTTKEEFLQKVKDILDDNPGRKVNMHFSWAEWAKIEDMWDDETMCVMGEKIKDE